jgi:hypothetical protein
VLRNKRLELTKPALALDAVVRQGWITIPAGETIRVLAGPNGERNQMIDVLWQDRMLTMLAIDVTAGCKEIEEVSDASSRSSASFGVPPQSHNRPRKRR